MQRITTYIVVVILLLHSAKTKMLTNCRSGLKGDGIKLAEGGTVTSCMEKTLHQNGSMEVFKFKVNHTLLESKTPFLDITFDVDRETDYGINDTATKLTKKMFLDIIVHTDSSGACNGSNDNIQMGTEEDNEKYHPSPHAVRNTLEFANFAVYIFPTTDNLVRVNVSVGLEDVRLMLGKPRSIKMTPISPSVFKYIYDKKEKKRVRVHVKRAHIAPKDVTSGCSVVSIQGLDEPISNLEDDKTSKNPWQTMLGQSIIDVNVGEFMTRSRKQRKNEFAKGFLVVIRKINEKYCNTTETTESIEYTIDQNQTVNNRILHEVHFSRLPSAIFVNQKPYDGKPIEMKIQLVELDTDVSIMSYKIFGVMILLIIVFLLWEGLLATPLLEKYQWLSITGNVNHDNGLYANERSDVHAFLDINEDVFEDTSKTTDHSPSSSAMLSELGTDERRNGGMFRYIRMDGRLGQLEKRVGDKLLAGQKRKKKSSCKGSCHQKITKTTLKELRLIDLSTQCDIILFLGNLDMKSGQYFWFMLISGIFYYLPAIQLMFGAQELSKHTGSQDLCYYNFLCLNEHHVPLFGRIRDWGNVFSNLAYIFAGAIFIVVVWRRSCRRRIEMVKLYEKNKETSKKIDNEKSKDWLNSIMEDYDNDNIAVEYLNQRGIPEQYGIYYAMGGATIFEGLLSASYHVCPTRESFQFDTTFMYIILVLIFQKFYQFRHPDITANAYISFCVIGLALIMETVSYHTPANIYPIVFSGVHIFTMLFLVAYMYLNLYNQTTRHFAKTWLQAVENVCCKTKQKSASNSFGKTPDQDKKTKSCKAAEPGNRGRSILFGLIFIGNIIITVYYIVDCNMSRSGEELLYDKDSVVSNVLLLILGFNMITYVIYYVFMKHYYWKKGRDQRKNTINEKRSYFSSNESISFRCLTYIFLAVLFLGGSFYFFQAKQRTCKLSPSQSRNMNEECTLLIFDHHDLWHLLSAFGILFMMLAVLTIEDNNTNVPWKQIHVF